MVSSSTNASTSNRIAAGDLIGRDRDLVHLHALLDDRDQRLITVTGPGGVGKTRLVNRVTGDRAQTDPRRVVTVGLAGVRECGHVLSAIAHRLEIEDRSTSLDRSAIVNSLRETPTLIVLDNLEHLPCVADVVAGILAAVPRIAILATSRSRIHLREETVVEVAPLAVPSTDAAADPNEIAGFAAVELFVQRVHAVHPAFTLSPANAAAVAAICGRIEGLPLAIELVASRARTLSVHEMLARLEIQEPESRFPRADVHPRQWSMQASVRWSHDLLPRAIQQRLCALAIFPGSFDLHAAAEIAGISEPEMDVLLDHHLVSRLPERDSQAPRFALPEPVRHFGIEHLRSLDAEAAIRDQHARYICDLMEWLEPRYQTADWAAALATAQHHLDDVFAALAWSVDGGDAHVAVRITSALLHVWVVAIPWETSHRWIRRVIDATRDVLMVDDDLTARLHMAAGLVAYHAERLAESELHLERAVASARRSGIPATLGYACGFYGQTLRARGDLERAEHHQREAMALADETGDPKAIVHAYSTAGSVALFQAEFERAWSAFSTALDAARSLGYPGAVANVLHFLGYVEAARGDFASGRAALLEARAVQLAYAEDGTQYLSTLCGLGRLELLAGRPREAAHWLSETLAGRFRRRERVRTRDALLDMGRLALLARDPARAARIFGAVDAETVPPQENRLAGPLWRAAVVDAKRQLGETEFRSAYRQGRFLTQPQAVAESLAFAGEIATRNPAAAEPLVSRPEALSAVPLSAREIDVLRLVMEGKSDREIGADLFISPLTASKHVKNILKKLSASSRAAATAIALRRGMVTPGT